MSIPKELLDILVCPQCKGKVVLSEKGEELLCYQCSLSYPISEGIPVMLVEEAKKLDKPL